MAQVDSKITQGRISMKHVRYLIKTTLFMYNRHTSKLQWLAHLPPRCQDYIFRLRINQKGCVYSII